MKTETKTDDKKHFNKWLNSFNTDKENLKLTAIKTNFKEVVKNPYVTLKEDNKIKNFYKSNFDGLHFKNNNPDLNLNDLETEFKTLLNDFKTRKNKTENLRNCLNNILKIKYSVSTQYIRSFFNATYEKSKSLFLIIGDYETTETKVLTPEKKKQKLKLLSKGFNIENHKQINLIQKSYFIWNFDKVTYGYNKLDLNENGFNKYLKKNVVIKKIKVLPTLKQQNKRYEFKNFRNFLSI